MNHQEKKKIPVAILGATGSVGQRFVEMLTNHPWFEIAALAASERSVGKPYRDAVNWLMPTALSPAIGDMVVRPCLPDLPCSLVFSGLDASVAGEIETSFAEAGYMVLSNARNHRMSHDVPLLVPEVNSDHLSLIHSQKFSKGKIITNPNCSTIGLVMALKPLLDAFGLEAVNVVTLQAISGAGYPGVASLDIMDNVIPFIKNEEHKIETETHKILGALQNGQIKHHDFKISAQCNRVPVSDGHLECVSVTLKTKAKPSDLIEAWRKYTSDAQTMQLPTAPKHPIYYFDEDAFPQPKRHRQLDKGMALSVGRLRECAIFDYKFAILSHNTIRGAAGCALLNAELLVKHGHLKCPFPK
jgi:aspartate-semialdehyde dehydrogenase